AAAHAHEAGETVEVIGVTSHPGPEVPIRNVPANVQVFRDINRQGQNSLTDYLERNPGSVSINNAQGNPFQVDVNFRGFTASPVLGVPQGVSVFQNGARINEPFGDVVNWDLVPQSAIARIQLVPGSNPAFGLNTLGGALAIETKRGRDHPGGTAQVSAGSFGRKAAEIEQGGKAGAWDYFVTANGLNEKGWADHNPSRIRQFFGQGGYQDGTTDIDLGMTLADNRLEGTQTLPASFADNPKQAYTYPDMNTNRLDFLTMKASHRIRAGVTAGANLYWRSYRNSNVSSNVNDEFGEIEEDGLPDDVEATNDRSTIDQKSYGVGMQLTFLGTLAGRANQLVIGADADAGRATFMQESQDADFTPGRAAIATGDFELSTDARTTSRYRGLFLFDTWSISPAWNATVSGRYNQARVTIADQSGTAPELNGSHRFSRFNPAVGINFNPSRSFTAYAGYNEGMRAPTPIELTCADPEAPCKLPNNFLADPPLKKIVSKTMEIGARGKQAGGWSWSTAAYRTDLHDDIQFINSSGGASNAGYFQNVGRTRREGIELSSAWKQNSVGLSAHYSYIRASYLSAFSAPAEANTSADEDGAIDILPGNRIPGIPRHAFKLRLDVDVSDRWSLGLNAVCNSAIFVRGDENNRDARGMVPGYTVFNADTRYEIAKNLELSVRVNNVFNKRYRNFGVLGTNFFTGPNRTFDGGNPVSEPFYGYGAPRGMWLGVRYRW
ncbi:MAG: tonB dependent receptor family protein, partial [Paucimonas sp.]|nr:tonB dependent receptor family protein [Paucimonas sp.]